MTALLQLLKDCYLTLLWIHGLTAMFLIHGRGKMAALPAVIAVLLHNSAVDTWNDSNVVSTGKRGNGVSAVVTGVLLHHSAMDVWTECKVVSTV